MADAPVAEETAAKETKRNRDRANRQPAGQTTAGEDELGKQVGDEFVRPRTVATPAIGIVGTTNTEADKSKKPELGDRGKKLAKALGKKSSQVLGFNEQTGVIVTDDGGKYQLSKNGKAVRHLSGPRPPEDMDVRLVDARVASPFSGTSAAINASVHEGTPADGGKANLQQEREDLKNRLAEIDEEIGEEDEEDDEDDSEE